MGINVSRGSKNGIVSGNLIGNSATTGLNIGANGNGLIDRCECIHVHSNTSYDNGYNAVNNPENSCGMAVRNADGIIITDNASFDSGIGRQRNGLVLQNETNTIHVPNRYKGNTSAEVFTIV